MEFNYLIGFLVFLSYFVIDALYVKYTLEVVKLNPARSATIGATIHILLAFGIINYTQNWFYIIPVVMGSWFGTYFVLKRENKKKRKK